jgi:flagellin-specific chaperone FliS
MPVNPYAATETVAASGAELVQQAFGRILRRLWELERALTEIRTVDRGTLAGLQRLASASEAKDHALEDAQALLHGLINAADVNQPGEAGAMAGEFRRIYAFAGEQIVMAAMAGDPAPVALVRDLLQQLAEAWSQVVAEGRRVTVGA